MLSRKLSLSLMGLALGTFGFASTALSQSATVGDETVAIGAAEVSVPWNLEGGGGLRALNIDITFDTTLFAPQTEADGQLIRCLENVPASVTSCQTIGDGSVIRIALLQLPPNALGDQSGTLVFDIVGVAADGDVSPLSVEINNANPGGTTVDATSGSVTFQALTAVLNVAPATLNFGTQQTGSTSAPRPVTISNDGSDGIDLEVTDINITGDFGPEGGGTCPALPFTLADGASCTQHVEFSPSADGAATGTLTVVSDAGQVTNDTVALSGEGVPSDANLSINPTAHDFGPLDLNDPAGSQAFTVTNTGTNNTVTGIAVPDLAGPFSITANTCGATLTPQATCQITVAFDPTEEGNFTATLAVNSDANNVSATLSGEGTAEADISVNPPFGPVNLGSASAGETITVNSFAGQPTAVTNSGSAAATVSCALEDESTAGVFSTAPSLASVPVAAGATVEFSLSCALPADADDGDVFTATLACSVDGEAAGTHELECSVDEFEPIPVPTMSAWSITLFALLMLLVGGISIRMFRV